MLLGMLSISRAAYRAQHFPLTFEQRLRISALNPEPEAPRLWEGQMRGELGAWFGVYEPRSSLWCLSFLC